MNPKLSRANVAAIIACSVSALGSTRYAHAQYTSTLNTEVPYFVGIVASGSDTAESEFLTIPYAVGESINSSSYSIANDVLGATFVTTWFSGPADFSAPTTQFVAWEAGFTTDSSLGARQHVWENSSTLPTFQANDNVEGGPPSGNNYPAYPLPTTIGAEVYVEPYLVVSAYAPFPNDDPTPNWSLTGTIEGEIYVSQTVTANNFFTPPSSTTPITVTYNGSSGTWNGGAPNAECAEITFTNSSVPVEVDIPSPGITLGTVVFDSSASFTIAGPGSLTVECPTNGGHVMVIQGSHQISAVTYILSDTDFTVPTGSTLTMSALVSSQPNLTLNGGGTLVVNQLNANSLTINNGTVKIIPQPANPNAVNVLNSMSIAGPSTSPFGTLDIGNATVQLNYSSGSSPLATIQAMVTSGYNGGSWNGTGIISSNVALHASNHDSPSVAVGYMDDGSGTVTIGYVLGGDANMDGTVDIADFGILSANYGLSGRDWQEGDFNYDGVVNIGDFDILSANYGDSIGDLPDVVVAGVPDASSLIPLEQFAAAHDDTSEFDAIMEARGITLPPAVVPEPTTIFSGLAALGFCSLLRLRSGSKANLRKV
jgi:hypothetical protein